MPTPRRTEPNQALIWVAGLVAVVVAVAAIAVFQTIWVASTHRNQSVAAVAPFAPVGALLPWPVPQKITRTSGGAQVAWLDTFAIDPSGRLAATLDPKKARGFSAVWRSADGATIFTISHGTIASYSALDGKVQWTHSLSPSNLQDYAFSPDGRWLAILDLNEPKIQLTDLRTGSEQRVPIAYGRDASLPDTGCGSGGCNSMGWGMVVFAHDSRHLYALTGLGGPTRLTALSISSGKLSQTASAAYGNRIYSGVGCSGGSAMSIAAAGHKLVAFCHATGNVWFFDLPNLSVSRVIHSNQGDPFWLTPIFTPDGQLLYIRQSQGIGDTVDVVDLANGNLFGPVRVPTGLDQGGPLGWLITNAYADIVSNTVHVSPDGLKLYSATDNGVLVLRVPDLKPLARLAPGVSTRDVWISGDGHTIYATLADGKRLVVMRDDGSHQKLVTLPASTYGFDGSEHG